MLATDNQYSLSTCNNDDRATENENDNYIPVYPVVRLLSVVQDGKDLKNISTCFYFELEEDNIASVAFQTDVCTLTLYNK